MFVDLEMLRRYDRPGPRYTSYPTAPQFTTDFGRKEFEHEIQKSNQEENPTDLSLYFHLPFCDTLCYFCGCTMIITRNRQRIEEYVDYLAKEIQLVGSKIKSGRRVAQLHWGGGTPTYLSPEQIRRLFDAIREHFAFRPDAEISVEIDPRGLTDAHLDALRDVGFNRASMGVQDFNPEVQRAVNRLQSEQLTRRVCEGLRERGFLSINLDLIYGLPHQTADSFARTLDRIIAMEPDRLAVFNYAHVPWLKKHQRVIDENTLPKAEEKLRILKSTIEKLTSAGYVYIGMDHFARQNDPLTQAFHDKSLYRNFQGYSTLAGCDLYGLGMSSISQLREVYAQNTKEIPRYYGAIGENELATYRGYRLTPDDHLRRHVIMTLMCDFELDKHEVEERFHIDFDRYFEDALPELEQFAEDGLIETPDSRIVVTETGHLLIRNIAMAFDKYLARQKPEQQVYSRTV
ncbi:MAG: oxygen-independent coproporphyrinogen III oxidase [Calditrichaeota bacterium]|nr:MAG: oxygen-independent coproporphyrinogen III oxidase [Calditrichota bacterium]